MATIKYAYPFENNHFEKTAWLQEELVCGIDEVGRGCLAGPVVTAAVILFPNKQNDLIRDSKLLSQKELQTAYKWISDNAWYSYGITASRYIDRYNIYQATLLTMKRTLIQLFTHIPKLPHTILVDAMPVNIEQTIFTSIDVLYFPFGEQKSTSIAAASIFAKVTRDNIMKKLAVTFPRYNLGQHKGYATQKHRDAIAIHGPSLIHRTSFLKNKPWGMSTKPLFNQAL